MNPKLLQTPDIGTETAVPDVTTKHESRPSRTPNNVFTYRRLRRMIGLLGITLPITLVLFSFIPFFATEIQPSISHHYYTHLREIFTGNLCGVSLFLICYKGHGNPFLLKNDNFLTNFAGLMAFGVAFFPTSTDNFPKHRVIVHKRFIHLFLPV